MIKWSDETVEAGAIAANLWNCGHLSQAEQEAYWARDKHQLRSQVKVVLAAVAQCKEVLTREAQVRELVDTLRKHCILTSFVEGSHGNMIMNDHECLNCESEWKHGKPEKHKHKCIVGKFTEASDGK